MKVAGDNLVIMVDLTRPGAPSTRGKTKLVASTRSSVEVDYKRPGLKVAVNVTVPA